MTLNYIYKIINQVNGKIYVGQTRKTIDQRMNEHITASFSNSEKKDYNFLLHKAIRKYGSSNFTIEQIEEVSDEANLSEREQYWIAFFHSCILEENSWGYNMTYGGEGSSYINKCEVFSLWKKGYGSVSIANQMGHAPQSIKNILVTFEDYNKEVDFARNTGVTVYCYDANGVLIAQYPSIAFAAKTVGVDSSMINKCCNGVKKSCRGFFWSYSNEENFSPSTLKTWRQLQVIQLSKDGTIVAEYESMSAAGRAMNKKQTKYIKECCEGKRKEMYGYIWKYKQDYVDELAQAASLAYKE